MSAKAIHVKMEERVMISTMPIDVIARTAIPARTVKQVCASKDAYSMIIER